MAAKTPTKKATVPKSAGSSHRPDGDSGDSSRLISLSGGALAYVCYPRGSSTKVRTDSEQFAELIATMTAANLGLKVRSEIAGFVATWPDSNWPSVLDSLDARGAFTPA